MHPEQWQVLERHNPIYNAAGLFPAKTGYRFLCYRLKDAKKLSGDIELQNHWHTVLAHRATAQSPLLISTGIFVFFWGVLPDTQAMRTL